MWDFPLASLNPALWLFSRHGENVSLTEMLFCREVGSLLWHKLSLEGMASGMTVLEGLINSTLIWRLAQMTFVPKSIYAMQFHYEGG